MMKTSTKLILSAIVLMIIAIGVYNNALKAEYLTGNYKKHYSHFNKLKIKDFTEVDVNAANMLDIEFQQGDFAVYKAKYNQDSVLFKQTGKRLTIDLNLEEKPEFGSEYKNGVETKKIINEDRNDKIIIICPNLSMIKTEDYFLVKGKKLDKYNYPHDFNFDHDNVQLRSFKMDSLTLIQNGRGKVAISGNVIKYLKADAGRGSNLTISENKINNAELHIKAGAELTLYDLAFKVAPGTSIIKGAQSYTHLTQNISDSAKVKTDGFILKILTDKKQ